MRNMFRYCSNKDNDDYLMIDIRGDFGNLIMEDIPQNIQKEIRQAFLDFFQYQKENESKVLETVALRKDSVLGQFILSSSDLFFNDDNYISYEKVVNAYNIAVFENDDKMANKILPLFKNRMSGMKEEFSDFPEKVISYISRNADFYHHLKSKDNIFQYLVYEDGIYQRKNLKLNEKINCKTLGEI